VVFLVVVDVDEGPDRLLGEILVRPRPEGDDIVGRDVTGEQRDDAVVPLPVVDRQEIVGVGVEPFPPEPVAEAVVGPAEFALDERVVRDGVGARERPPAAAGVSHGGQTRA